MFCDTLAFFPLFFLPVHNGPCPTWPESVNFPTSWPEKCESAYGGHLQQKLSANLSSDSINANLLLLRKITTLVAEMKWNDKIKISDFKPSVDIVSSSDHSSHSLHNGQLSVMIVFLCDFWVTNVDRFVYIQGTDVHFLRIPKWIKYFTGKTWISTDNHYRLSASSLL